MENWQQKQPEKMSHGDAALQVLENARRKDEVRLSEESGGRDISKTRELLAQAYPEALARAKNILEGKE